MEKLSDLLKPRTTGHINRDHRNSYEHQAYGNRLADELADPKHRALYIKLAKSENRVLLEKAREAAIASDVVNKGKIFMWKLTELKKALTTKE